MKHFSLSPFVTPQMRPGSGYAVAAHNRAALLNRWQLKMLLLSVVFAFLGTMTSQAQTITYAQGGCSTNFTTSCFQAVDVSPTTFSAGATVTLHFRITQHLDDIEGAMSYFEVNSSTAGVSFTKTVTGSYDTGVIGVVPVYQYDIYAVRTVSAGGNGFVLTSVDAGTVLLNPRPTISITLPAACTAPSAVSAPTTATICSGQNATFTANGSGGTTPYTYAWEFSDQQTTGFASLVPYGTFSGAATNTLTITPANSQPSTRWYRLRVSNSCGSVVSAAAQYIVRTAPTGTPAVSPAAFSKCVTAGTPYTNVTGTTITASAPSGGTTPFTYEWEFSDNNGGWVSLANYPTSYPGYNTNTLAFAAASNELNGRRYRAKITNACGSTYSAISTFTMNQAPVTPAIVAPAACSGKAASFSVTPVAGLTYEWQYNDGNGWGSLVGFADYPGANTANMSTLNYGTYGSAQRQFRVVAKSSAGCSTPSNGVSVTSVLPPAAPVITAPSVCSNSTTATYTVTPVAGLTYEWEFADGGAYASLGGYASTYPGWNTATMTSPSYGGTRTYRVIAKNSTGCTTASNGVGANVVIAPTAPVITAPTICSGSTTATYTVTPVAGLTYEWEFADGGAYASLGGYASTYPGWNTATMTSPSNGGTRTYRVKATNSGGCSATSNGVGANITALPSAPTATITQPTCAVQTGTITVSAPTETGMTYSIDGTNYQASGTFTSVAPGTYSVTARNAGGCTSSASSVTVNAVPSCGVQLSVKVMLQGSYTSGTSMRNDLMTGVNAGASLLPLSQPFATGQNAASTYAGTESVSAMPANAVDWVLVQLRSTANGNNVQTRAGILLQDGNVVGTAAGFTSPLSFTAPAASYYVVVHHRNHLGVMSAAPVALGSSTATYDFTTGNDKAYTGTGVDGNNTPMTQLAPGVFGLWAGDANKDGQVYYYGPGSDAEAISIDYLANDPDNGYNNLYEAGDINMDGQTYYYGPGSDAEYLSITPLTNDPVNGYLSEQVPVQASPGGRMMPARRGPLPKK